MCGRASAADGGQRIRTIPDRLRSPTATRPLGLIHPDGLVGVDDLPGGLRSATSYPFSHAPVRIAARSSLVRRFAGVSGRPRPAGGTGFGLPQVGAGLGGLLSSRATTSSFAAMACSVSRAVSGSFSRARALFAVLWIRAEAGAVRVCACVGSYERMLRSATFCNDATPLRNVALIWVKPAPCTVRGRKMNSA
jgi:hypothetical protein